jgi:hypothetical protein
MKSDELFSAWLAPPVLDRSKTGKAMLYNPLMWWQGQRAVGNEWDGLMQMAIDILSCPGKYGIIIL